MTKIEAEEEFKILCMPGLIQSEANGSGRVDAPGRRMAWNDYVDTLQKKESITAHQADTWTRPKWLLNKMELVRIDG